MTVSLFYSFAIFLLFGTCAILFIYIVKLHAKLHNQNIQYENLQNYTTEIEQLYLNIRGFKHDYVNMLATMQQYMEENNWDALTIYYQQEILPTRDLIQDDSLILGQLCNLKIPELKSIYYNKYITALEQGIQVELEVPNPVTQINAKYIDLARIISIYLDNAIEALQAETSRSESQILNSAIIDSPEAVTFIIENHCEEFSLNINELGAANYSTKGQDRGMGLHIASQIMGNYKNIQSTTNYENNMFTQILKIYKE